MSEGNNQTRRRIVPWVLSLSAVLIVIAGFAFSSSQSAVPDTSQISGMRAALLVGPDRLEFSVPPKHWDKVLDALKPYEVDPRAAKWQVLGSLVMRRTGPDLEINLFETDEPGAFAIEGMFSRTYYRGGNSSTLKAALLKAYESSEDRKSESMMAK